MKHLFLVLLALILVSSSSCSKVEGRGGAATIKGSLLGKKYNAIGNLISEYPMIKEKVYIIYGTNTTSVDDKTDTSYDGSFEFRNLQPGTYTVFAYSKAPSQPGGKVAVLKTITISKAEKKQAVDVGVIEVRD